jgi:hypothetical protein
MRVGIATSWDKRTMHTAWQNLPTMRRYCRTRGYTLVVGKGMSPDGMFATYAHEFETAMLFLPISFVITDPSVQLKHDAPPTTIPPAGLGYDSALDFHDPEDSL